MASLLVAAQTCGRPWASKVMSTGAPSPGATAVPDSCATDRARYHRPPTRAAAASAATQATAIRTTRRAFTARSPVEVVEAGAGQFVQEAADPLRHRGEVAGAFLGRGGARIADAGVVGHPAPRARRPGPSLPEPGGPEAPGGTGTGLGKGADE